jgi:hypothetical protein
VSRKRTVRREYLLIDPIEHAKHQASKLTAAEWDTQMKPVIIAMEQLAQGVWTRDTWQPMFECLNRIESLMKLNHIKSKEWLERSQNAMRDAVDRKATTGVAAFKGPELTAVREIVAVYGDLLKEASHRQFAEACRHTNANVDRILRHKSQMHVSDGFVFERKAA